METVTETAPDPQTDIKFNSLMDYGSKLLQEGEDEFQANTWAQANIMTRLAEIWPKLEPSQQTIARKMLVPNLPRLNYTKNPEREFTNILRLGKDVDIQRALRWTPLKIKEWKLETGEGVYNGIGGWLGEYLEYVKYNSVPLAFHFWSGVMCISAASRRNFYVERDAYRIWLNMFVILAGVKGTTKSFAYSQCIDVLKRMNRTLGPENKLYHVNLYPEDATQEFIVNELAGLNYKTMMKVPGLEGWSEIAQGDATALIHCDELSNFLGKGTYNIGKKAPFLTSICFGSSYGKGTKGDGESVIENMAVGVFACSAPEWMRGTIHSDAMSGGLVDRWEVVHRPMCIERPYSKPEILDPIRANQLADWLRKLAQPPTSGRQMMLLTPRAEEWFDEFYYSQHEKRKKEMYNPNVKSLGRFSNQVMRLGAILCLSEYETVPMITVTQLKKAREILDVEEPFFGDFIEQASMSPIMEDACGRLMRFVVQKGPWVPKAEFTKRFSMTGVFRGRGGPAATIQQYLDDMVETGKLIVKTKGKAKLYGLPGSDLGE